MPLPEIRLAGKLDFTQRANTMDAPTPGKMAKQPFSRNEKVIPKREKMHPAVTEAMASFAKMHGHKFGSNAGRGFKKKS